MNVLMENNEWEARCLPHDLKGWKPANPRPRKVSVALKTYAAFVSSADTGAVRDLSKVD